MEETLFDLLGLPDVSHVVYQKSPLALALCQVKFTRVLGVAQSGFVAPFQEAIRARYPVAEATENVHVEFGLGPGAAQLRQEPRGVRWRFADPEDNWYLVLAEDFIGLESRAYESFSDFLERLRDAIVPLAQHIRPSLVTRIGLRYINEIRSESLVWTEVLSPELLGPLAVPQLAAGIKQSTQELLLRYDHGFGVNLRHGLFPRGTTVKPRRGHETSSELSRPFYLLDLDAHRQFPLPGGLPLDVDAVCHTVRIFNRANYRLFRWAVTEQFVNGLGVLRYAAD